MDDLETTVDTTGAIEEDTDAGLDVEPRIYELGYHIIPAIAEEDTPAEAARIKELIGTHEGKVIAEEAPTHVALAYTMYRIENGKKEKFDTAHFGSIKFEMNPEQVSALKETLEQDKNILRFIIFKTVRENTRSDFRFPQSRSTERKPSEGQQKPAPARPVSEEARTPEKSNAVSDEELDKSIEGLVVE